MEEIKKPAPKTKKCDWCKKRKPIKDIYILGAIPETGKKVWCICVDCNHKNDVI